MPYALFCQDAKLSKAYPTEADVWKLARQSGLVVDAVSDVHSFSAENIQPPPEAVGSVDQMFVLGLAKHEDRLVIILDIERLVISSVLGDAKAA